MFPFPVVVVAPQAQGFKDAAFNFLSVVYDPRFFFGIHRTIFLSYREEVTFRAPGQFFLFCLLLFTGAPLVPNQILPLIVHL